MRGSAPTLAERTLWSPQFHDFVAKCLNKVSMSLDGPATVLCVVACPSARCMARVLYRPCAAQDPLERPDAVQLLSHPFVATVLPNDPTVLAPFLAASAMCAAARVVLGCTACELCSCM